MMSEKILFVDDDQKILNGITRQFEGVFELETATSPQQALELIESSSSFGVVVSDMRMPGMSGIDFLARVRKRSPNSTRIMLTGYADLEATIEAVNEGNIFRFLTKPCPQSTLQKAILDGLTQYRLVIAEHQLLEGTLDGSIRVLSEILSLVNPVAFGRTSQVQRIALAIAEEMEAPNPWDLKIATMLFPIGCITVSKTALESVLNGRILPERERAEFQQHASIAEGMLRKIPRLENVASIVAFQDKCFDGSGHPNNGISGHDIPLEARILKVASDFEIAYKRTGDTARAVQILDETTSHYDPAVVVALRSALRNGLCQASHRELSLGELVDGMVFAADVRAANGMLMVTCGQKVTESLRRRLQLLCDDGVIVGKFLVEMLGRVNACEYVTV